MKKLMFTAVMVAMALSVSGCLTPAQKPLCRHIVLSQYAAFVDAGYETEIWHMKNDSPAKAGGFKYHAAVRIKKDGKWLWVEQPKLIFTTTVEPPMGTTLTRKMAFSEVSGWAERNATAHKKTRAMTANATGGGN